MVSIPEAGLTFDNVTNRNKSINGDQPFPLARNSFTIWYDSTNS